ncbi:type I-E CRISPR-associated protein Cas5/CasD [Salinibacter grassmerensis]|uniref:type I-E CRISPR-associated protein Cas5/CasD n=1 Tax=Salinibacter grassmerensis TaxID=3040353 RepID=UPI0021E7B708|nr:type I-E CRISPR-associated protein Cas5/CasD [Salinibacter grassmerensis]
MTVSILRFKAPLMGFGAPTTGAKIPTRRFPPQSMICGLIANGLGYDQSEAERHQKLQASLTYAARADQPGEVLQEYQTTDLGQPKMYASSKTKTVGWTTRGEPEFRDGDNKTETEQTYKDYLMDASYTVAVRSTLLGEEAIRKAMIRPERPLFLGRKCCIPSARIWRGTVEAEDVLGALRVPETFSGEVVDRPSVWCPAELAPTARSFTVTDKRDWSQQIHSGQRRVAQLRLSAAGYQEG